VPIILDRNDPALVATLAGNAGVYKTGLSDQENARANAASARADQQQTWEQAFQRDQATLAYHRQGDQLELQRQALEAEINQRQNALYQQQHAQPQYGPSEEVLANGARIYNPAGTAPNPTGVLRANQLAGAESNLLALQQYGPATAQAQFNIQSQMAPQELGLRQQMLPQQLDYEKGAALGQQQIQQQLLPGQLQMQQQAMQSKVGPQLATVDQLVQAGKLDATTGQRWKAILQMGGDPFTQQTTSEQTAATQQTQDFQSRMQRERLDVTQSDQAAKLATAEAGRKDQAIEFQKQAAQERVKSIDAQIKTLTNLITAAPGDTKLKEQLANLMVQRDRADRDYQNTLQSAAAQIRDRQQQQQQASQQTQAAMTKRRIPISEALRIKNLIDQTSDAFGRGSGTKAMSDAEKAREFEAEVIRRGYDPALGIGA
jgi:hypothetical protein